jgi:hypothetical protein
MPNAKFGSRQPAMKNANVLLIMTDQQSADALSCAGNPYLNTPSLDRLDLAGVRMECDPREATNLAADPGYAEILERHRAWLQQWCKETSDSFAKAHKADVE